MGFRVEGSTLNIQFDSREAAEHFKTWLQESGEEDYWIWMDEAEPDIPRDARITSIEFDYEQGHIIPATSAKSDTSR